jgi:hypothetical protein
MAYKTREENVLFQKYDKNSEIIARKLRFLDALVLKTVTNITN